MVKISRPCPRFSSVRFRIIPDTPIMNGWNRRGRVRVKSSSQLKTRPDRAVPGPARGVGGAPARRRVLSPDSRLPR